MTDGENPYPLPTESTESPKQSKQEAPRISVADQVAFVLDNPFTNPEQFRRTLPEALRDSYDRMIDQQTGMLHGEDPNISPKAAFEKIIVSLLPPESLTKYDMIIDFYEKERPKGTLDGSVSYDKINAEMTDKWGMLRLPLQNFSNRDDSLYAEVIIRYDGMSKAELYLHMYKSEAEDFPPPPSEGEAQNELEQLGKEIGINEVAHYEMLHFFYKNGGESSKPISAKLNALMSKYRPTLRIEREKLTKRDENIVRSISFREEHFYGTVGFYPDLIRKLSEKYPPVKTEQGMLDFKNGQKKM